MRKLSFATLVIAAVLAVAAATLLRSAPTLAGDGQSADLRAELSQAASLVQPPPSNAAPSLQVHTDPGVHSGDQRLLGKHAFAGITIRTLTKEELEALGEPDLNGGVRVVEVLDGGPAAELLEEGDVIIAIDGEEVTSARDVVMKVLQAEADTDMTFTVIRGGKTLDVIVRLGERELQDHSFRSLPGPDVYHRLLGVVKGLRDRFVRLEIVLETDDGFKTYRAVTGIPNAVDVQQGTFLLEPGDDSTPIPYETGPGTIVNMTNVGSLGGLNEVDKALVIDVLGDDGGVLLVLQPYPPRDGRFGGSDRIEPKLKSRGPGLHMRPGFRGFRGLPGGAGVRMRKALPGVPSQRFDGEHLRRFTDRLPFDFKDLIESPLPVEQLPQGGNELGANAL